MEFYSLIFFIFINSITPGPNNISSFVFSSAIGYQKTLNYILGIMFGTSIVLSLSGLMIDILLEYIESLGEILKWFAAVYILYLAYKSINLTATNTRVHSHKPSFLNGLILQFINPKAILFGITLYSGFLHKLASNSMQMILSALFLSFITFLSVSVWSFSGNLMMKYLGNERILKTIGISMAILLMVYAIQIAEVF